MFDFLISLDKKILLAINNCNSAFFDDFLYIFSGRLVWILTAAAIIYVIFRTQKMRDVWFVVLGIVLLITLSDQISSHLIKPLVERLRPAHEPTLQGLVHIVHNYRGGGWSFPSSHAANGFAFAVFTSLLFKNRLYSFTIFVWATLTAYSRMYLGVHYPIDVFCGSIVGVAIGFGVYWLLYKVKQTCCIEKISCKNALIISTTFLFTLIIMFVFHTKLVFLG